MTLVGGSNYMVSAYAMNPELHGPLFTFPDGQRRVPSPHEFVVRGGRPREFTTERSGTLLTAFPSSAARAPRRTVLPIRGPRWQSAVHLCAPGQQGQWTGRGRAPPPYSLACGLATGSDQHVVTGGEDHSLCLWELPETLPALTPDRREDEVEVLRPLSHMLAHSGHVVGVAWSDVSHGEAHLASVGARPRSAATAPDPGITRRGHAPSPRRAGNDHALRIWKLDGHSLSSVQAATPAHDMTVSAVCWGRQQSRDTIFTGGWDRKVLAWDHMDLKSGPIGVLGVRASGACGVAGPPPR